MPFSVHDNVDHPISLYAATKKANELMAHTYSYLYGIPTTGLRFFTVYGPWGRPDMALFKFTKAILNDDPINVYNEGKMRRDFTYIDDIVEGVVRVTDNIPSPQTLSPEGRGKGEGKIPSPLVGEGKGEGSIACHVSRVTGPAPYRLYNIGNHNPIELMDFIHAIEESLGKKAKMNFLSMQPGDVPATYADVDDLIRDVGFSPSTPVQEGIRRFIEWYKRYYT
jgi:UDP-glucuronate 4-epimerase